MAVINFMVVPLSTGVVDLAPRLYKMFTGTPALHAPHAVELSDVILACEQSPTYRGKARDGQRRSRDVLHCSKPFSYSRRGLSRPYRDL